MKNRCHVLFVFFRKIIHEEDDTVANGDRLIQKFARRPTNALVFFYNICYSLYVNKAWNGSVASVAIDNVNDLGSIPGLHSFHLIFFN